MILVLKTTEAALIVCHCNVIRDRELRAVARDCGGCVRTAYARLGCEVQCGSCLDTAEDIVDAESRELLAA